MVAWFWAYQIYKHFCFSCWRFTCNLNFSRNKLREGWCGSVRSSLWHILFKICAPKNFAIFTGKHLSWNLFLIKFQTWRPVGNFIKKRLQHRYFPMNIAKFLRELFYRTALGDCFWIYTGRSRGEGCLSFGSCRTIIIC